MRDRNRRRSLGAAAAGAAMAAAACSLAIPGGDVPKVEHRWVVTPLEYRIGPDDLIDDKPIEIAEPVNVDDDTVSEIVDRVTGPTTITVTLTNPFPIEVRGTMDLGDTVPLTTAERSVTVAAGTRDEPETTVKTLTITPEELQAFLERGQFSFNGNAVTDGVRTLDPDQEIRVRVTVDVSVASEPVDA